MSPSGIYFENRAEVHWVYRLFDASGTLLYVGMTRRPVGRFQQWTSRRRDPKHAWFDSAVRVDWQQYRNWHAASAAEKLAIETEAPVHNIYHRPKLVA